MYTTVGDLARWDAGLDSLVSKAMLARAYTPPALTGGGQTRYGFGWIVQKMGDRTFVLHSGGLASFATFIVRDLESGDAFMALSNRSDANVSFDALARGVAAILAGGDPAPPKIPIGPVVRTIIETDGIEAAIASYAAIWTNAVERYDLRESHLNDLGYAYVRAGKLDIATALFVRNTESYPEAFNTWDSLAEVQLMKGMKAEAIRNYRKSLELNPDNTNARDILARIEADGG